MLGVTLYHYCSSSVPKELVRHTYVYIKSETFWYNLSLLIVKWECLFVVIIVPYAI